MAIASGASSDAAPFSSTTPSSDDLSDGVEWAARLGYAAKGVIYAIIGGLAVQQAVGRGGDIAGSREALREIASQSFGTVLLTLVTAGLGAYVIWRLVQALLDPEASVSSDDDTRWGHRAFYFASAVIYGALTWVGISILTGNGGGGGGSSPSSDGAQSLLSTTWGTWLLGIIGVAVLVRGALQIRKAYTESFKEGIRSFDLGPAKGRWILRASRVGLTARGVVFGIIGVSVVTAALTRDASEAEGTSGALAGLVGHPWLLGSVGVGLICYAIYQWVKARYRIIGV
jgi:hypothetical protein